VHSGLALGAGVGTEKVLPALIMLSANGARPTLTPLMDIAGPPGRAVCDATTRLEAKSTF